MSEQTHKVALVKFHEGRDPYDDYYGDYPHYLVNKLTDFTEIGHEEYILLKAYAKRTNNFNVIEYLPNQKSLVEFSVKSQVEFVKKEEKERLAEAERRHGKKQARLQRKLEEEAKSRKELLRILFEENPDLVNEVVGEYKGENE